MQDSSPAGDLGVSPIFLKSPKIGGFRGLIKPMITLRPYQLEIAKVIADSVVHRRGLTFSVEKSTPLLQVDLEHQTLPQQPLTAH